MMPGFDPNLFPHIGVAPQSGCLLENSVVKAEV